MAYFTKRTFDFLKALEKNNDREWFNDNKPRYINDVKEPFEKFIGDLIDALQPHFDTLPITPKDAIFRIYRDVRFSKDKSPYKTKVSALITPGGRKGMSLPGLYIELTTHDVRVYSGLYKLDTKQLANLRSHISHNLRDFNTLITDKQFVNTFGEVRGEKNKRLSKELNEDAEQQPLLFNKQFYYFVSWPHKVAYEDGLIKQVVDTYLVARPVSEFLYEGTI